MTLVCPAGAMTGGEKLVVCDSRQSKEAHQELFHLDENAYSFAEERLFFSTVSGLVEYLNENTQLAPPRIHLVMSWENLLPLSLWKDEKLSWGDISILLTTSGVRPAELAPLKGSDAAALFPWLYYGKRFDILKKLCHKVKKQVESRLSDTAIRVDCHLYTDYANMIVASSL